MDTLVSEGDLWPVMETLDAREVCDSWSCRWKNNRACKRKPLLCNWTKMHMLVCQKILTLYAWWPYAQMDSLSLIACFSHPSGYLPYLHEPSASSATLGLYSVTYLGTQEHSTPPLVPFKPWLSAIINPTESQSCTKHAAEKQKTRVCVWGLRRTKSRRKRGSYQVSWQGRS